MAILRLLKWMLVLLFSLGLLSCVYVAVALLAWSDIPVEDLEQRYGHAEIRVAEVDGVPFRYRLTGKLDGRRPVLVLVHSHYLDMGMWQKWVSRLAADFTVLRYDLSGHGLTGPDRSGRYTVARDVELLDGLLAELAIEQFSIVGSSLGGNIAFTMAAQQPARVQALVLVNSGGLKRSGPQASRSGRDIPAWADQVLPLVPPLALEKFLQWMAADKQVVDEALKTRFVDMWRREGNRPAELARLRQFETGDPDPLLASITAPTLVLWGEDNPQLPVALADEFRSKLSAAQSVEVKLFPRAGHLLPLERPETAAKDVQDFLRHAVLAIPATEFPGDAAP